jgi:uracil-DNA glycosylase family 4
LSSKEALAALNTRIIACNRCERLRAHCLSIAEKKRRAYMDWQYWGRPVPSFGDPDARVLLLGLAPGAHGSNRTGRPFTGDGSGDFLYPVLHDAGFASQPHSVSREDGMELRDIWITSVVRCAPPENKPLPEELANCAPFLDEEITALHELRVIVCLGKIAFDGFLAHLKRMAAQKHHENEDMRLSRRDPSAPPGARSVCGFVFAHGAEYKLPDGRWLLTSYHPSLQNTNTGKLTREMFLKIFRRARQLAQID